VGAPGHHYDGGFAKYLLVEAQTLVPLPDEVDFVMGAAASSAWAGSSRTSARRR
ncbi:MAG: alcohol dehydrogenase, partial [Microbacteriaceae bacterium]|nr:alcohol dehydrogenase [Microbacteriaceae bacterium]